MVARPKLEFYYSWIYDKKIHQWQGKRYIDTSARMIRYKNKLEKEWRKIERKAFDTISEVSGLEWKKPIIDCYLVKRSKGFSMPLTIAPRKNLKSLIETIIHELIHNIVAQNTDKIKKKDYKKYGKLSETTKIHILIHAILKEVLIKLFGEKQTRMFIRRYYKWPDYKKAWEIVEQKGSRTIIREGIKG